MDFRTRHMTRIVLTAFLSLSLFSCEEWIAGTETEPLITTEGYFTTVTDLERLLNGAYATLLGYQGEGLAGSPFLIAALGSDLVAPYPAHEDEIDPEIRLLYDHQVAAGSQNSPAFKMIKYASRAINNANMVIDALENGSLESDPDFLYNHERMRGEAYLIRAMANFEIVKLASKQYDPSTAGNDPGNYYPLSPVYVRDDFPAGRISVEETYGRLLGDIEMAENLLPVRWDQVYAEYGPTFVYQSDYYWKSRKFSQDVATALKAKVLFQKNDFSGAKAAVDQLLGPVPGESTKYPLSEMKDLNKSVMGNKSDGPVGPYLVGIDTVGDDKAVAPNQEIIFDFYGSSEGYGPNEGRNSWAYIFTPKYGEEQGRSKLGEQGTGWFVLSESFIWDFDWDYVDSRFFNFMDELEDEEFNYWYWPVKFAVRNLNVLWYRSAEFFLMRAECNARLGSESDALQDLDYVRERADLDPFGGGGGQELIGEIVRERARELFMEKNRYWDLLRLGALGELPGGMLPRGDRDQTVAWDDPALIFPMPELY